MEPRYWLSIGDGKTYGPYTVAELLRYRGDGRLPAAAQVCPEGQAEWRSAETVLELGGPGSTPPIAPPPPAPGAGPPAAPDPLAKSKVAAGVLGILLGALGIHNFYLGYTLKGLVQLGISVLTCGWLAPVAAVWGLIEGILILTGSIRVDGSGRPLRD